MIENQVYLAQGAWTKVIGRSEGLLAMCGDLHYALVGLHVRIQTAAAYAMLGKMEEAQRLLETAIADAAPDRLIIPFTENYGYLKGVFAELITNNINEQRLNVFIAKIMKAGKTVKYQKCGTSRPEALSELTNREYEIIVLMAKRLSNREIADRLFLSEGSVKQYIKHIYSKLHIEGDTRTKRAKLKEVMEAENSLSDSNH